MENIDDIAQQIRKKLNKKMIVSISGQLGVGKTTLIKHILKNDNVNVISPSFLHVLLYGKDFAHIDAYTFKSKEAFLSIGLEELLEERCIIIEWGELFDLSIFEAALLKIELKYEAQDRFIYVHDILYF